MFGFLPTLDRRLETIATAARLLAPSAPPRPLAGLPLALDAITDVETFEAVTQPAADIVANGRLTKFLIDARDPAAPKLHFINANFTRGAGTPDSARYHFAFAQEVLGISESLDEFNRLTYFTPGPKRYVAGVVHSYLLANEAGPVLGLQFYPQDVIAEEPLLTALQIARTGIALPGHRLAFVPTGSQQTTARIADGLATGGISVVSLDRILGAITYLPLNFGEAWGYLRIFPTDDRGLRPTDIPVFEELPLDLSVVAGVLTRAVQDTNSHVNLKSKERRTPNAVLRDAAPDNPRLAPFADQPVHFVVGAGYLTIEASTAEVVAAKLADRMDRPLVRLNIEAEPNLRSFADMAQGSPGQTLALSRRFGAKAANLAFLGHRHVLGRAGDTSSPSAEVGYDLVPVGIAVPFQRYLDFVAYEPNAAVRTAIEALVEGESSGALSPTELARLVATTRTAIMAAELPPAQLEELTRSVKTSLPGVKKVKVRSSANAEDIPDFDGAGLHDSFVASLKTKEPDCRCEVVRETDGKDVKLKVKPKSLGCAVKGVYASLWNLRAVAERSFARIDQSSVAMGLAIVPAYDTKSDVAANAVVVTRVLNTDAVYGYSLSVQLGNNLVTNPDPGTFSETSIAGFISDTEPISLTITRYAKPEKDGPVLTEPVLSPEQQMQIVEITRDVERAYCRAKPEYYDGDCDLVTADNVKPKALDLELKVLANGELVVKQVRELGGR
jgi:hypothetical protein